MECICCPSCSATFNSNNELVDHIREHDARIKLALKHVIRCQNELRVAMQHYTMSLSHDSNDSDEGAIGRHETPLHHGDENSDGSDDEDLSGASGSLTCPLSTCGKVKFEDSKGLRRHYATHVTCSQMCVWCAKEIAVVSKVFRHYDVCPRRRTQRQEKTRSFQTLNEREKSVRKKLRALVKNELNTANHQTSSTSNANKEDSLETTRSSDCVRGKRRHFPEALSAPPLSKRRLVINEGNAAQAYPSHQSHFGDATDALNNAEASGVWSAAFQNPESSLVAGNNAFQPVESVNQNDVNNPDAILPQVNFNSGNPFSAASDTVTADQYMMDMLSSTNALPRAPTLKVHTMDGPPLFLAAHYYEDIHNGSAPQQNPTEYFQATGGHK